MRPLALVLVAALAGCLSPGHGSAPAPAPGGVQPEGFRWAFAGIGPETRAVLARFDLDGPTDCRVEVNATHAQPASGAGFLAWVVEGQAVVSDSFGRQAEASAHAGPAATPEGPGTLDRAGYGAGGNWSGSMAVVVQAAGFVPEDPPVVKVACGGPVRGAAVQATSQAILWDLGALEGGVGARAGLFEAAAQDGASGDVEGGRVLYAVGADQALAARVELTAPGGTRSWGTGSSTPYRTVFSDGPGPYSVRVTDASGPFGAAWFAAVGIQDWQPLAYG